MEAENLKPIWEHLKDTLTIETVDNKNSLYEVSFEVKVYKDATDGRKNIKTIHMTSENVYI